MEITFKLDTSKWDAMDDVVYLSDPDTYDILYANHVVRNDVGKDPIGLKCYETFQGYDKPCSFCTNQYLFGENLGTPYVWECQNLVTGRWYRCVDSAVQWIDGRWVRFEVATDITEYRFSMQNLTRQKEKVSQLTSELLNVVSEERERLAFYLHADLGQRLVAIKCRLEALELDLNSDDAPQALQTVLRQLGETIRDVSTASLELIPPEMEGYNLESLVRTVIRSFKVGDDTTIQLKGDGKPIYVEGNIKEFLLLGVHELILNAIKHSGAKNITVRLETLCDCFHVMVLDDGVGFEYPFRESTSAKPSGFGLQNMIRRFRYINVDVKIRTVKGAGSSITIVIPRVGYGMTNGDSE